MKNKFSNIKERVCQYIDYKKLKKESFFRSIGMTSANFRGEAQKTPLNSTAIENILSKYPDINPIWLLSGTGDMLKIPTATADNNSVAVAGDHNTVSHGVEQKELELLRSENKHLQELLSAKDQIIHLLEKSQK